MTAGTYSAASSLPGQVSSLTGDMTGLKGCMADPTRYNIYTVSTQYLLYLTYIYTRQLCLHECVQRSRHSALRAGW